MKTILHKADTRGHANHGWLETYHTFSFANYNDPKRTHFGNLRVLNDDYIAGGRGFGSHPHDNMEIVTIPLSGDLEHQDSMGNVGVIRHGDVQIMSAGSGIYHSEKNKNLHEAVKLLQIWVFPKKYNIIPRYDQRNFSVEDRKNKFQTIVSPLDSNDGGIGMNQDAWFSLVNLDEGVEKTYEIKKSGNGVYVFVIEGEVSIDKQLLSRRDGFGISETESFTIKASKDAEVLLMDLPMQPMMI
jgi:quercetin 2,3-dioxygenase